MFAPALFRSVLVCWARANPVCIGGMVCVVAWPIVAPALSSGVSSRQSHDAAALYEVAFCGILLGTASGLIALGRLNVLLARASLTARWALAFATIVIPALATVVAAALAFGEVGGVEAFTMPPAFFVTSLAIGTLHVAAVAMALQASPLPASLRPLALIAITCALPALAPTVFAPIAALREDARQLHAQITDGWAASPVEFVPILAWLAAALLLEVPSTRRA